MLHETELQLQKEAKVVSGLLDKTALSREAVRKKLKNRKALAVTERLMSAKMIIWTGDQTVIYTDFRGGTLVDVLQQSNGAGQKFVSKTAVISAKNGMPKGYVTLVARLDQVQELNQLMRRSQIVSLIISALIAVILGLFFQRGLTRPIRMLTEQMKQFSLKRANREIRLQTNDEIGELAESFNALSRRLKKYDEDQKVFFQNASHELKTPLMAIQGNAEGILDGIVTGVDVNKSLNVIIAESQRLKRIVEGITYLAKLESVEESFTIKPEQLETVIQEAVQSVGGLAAQKGIDIVVECKVPDTLKVNVDREKIVRALINLLGNAVRYANSVVMIRSLFEAKGVRPDEKIKRESNRTQGKNEQDKALTETLIIEVIDDGPGLAKGEEGKVFQRFYSGQEGGSGIGLAITKAIIEGHGGTIQAGNGKQGGAVFRICLNEKPPSR
ncbi:sensor histidine kinase [Neobacillus endophyticus]|uniref:sensor histidine kinase n=1 Tax=Neobacillus endophyticus TaxID=2738405 RepID=UPI001C25208A|nr:HAMP domain-containing sensor histidine kinase [Neobacillus endophyticus]